MGNPQGDRAKHIGEGSRVAGAWYTPLHTANILDLPNKIKGKITEVSAKHLFASCHQQAFMKKKELGCFC